jgi:serine/threonine protein phosphatase PrpC
MQARGGVATAGAEIARACSRLSIAAASQAGPHHRVNEDSHTPLDGRAPVYVVADGVGGGAMAAWASRHLVTAVHRRLAERKPDATSFAKAMLDADREIARAIAHHSGASGAATVAACAAIDAPRGTWLVAWVGDCRAYVLEPGSEARLVTRDDTYRNLGEAPPPGGSPDDPARMIGNGAVSAPNLLRAVSSNRSTWQRCSKPHWQMSCTSRPFATSQCRPSSAKPSADSAKRPS